MDYCLISEKNNCKSCYKCIRNCPTKSISFNNNQASIIHEECILCGRCYLACPQGIKVIRDDLSQVKEMIMSKKKVVVSLAPSFILNYKNASIETMRIALKKLGFFDVEETAVGATIVKKAYDELLETNSRDIIISSCCHSINLLIQKHYPSLLPYLADVMSPMVAHGRDIKNRIPDAYVVFIGPCIAKKDEADKNENYVDAALTFIELTKWLKESNIEIKEEKDPIKITKSKARLFPTTGGILNSMDCKEESYEYLAIDGMESVVPALKNIMEGKIHKCFIEMSACRGSCINGPAIDNDRRAIITGYLNIHKAAGKKDFDVTNYRYKDIQKNYATIPILKAEQSESDIEECLKEMGKTTKNKELNCGCCGYDTCRAKAVAILEGKAVKEMCLPYLMEKALSFSDNIVNNTPNGIMVLNEKLDIQLMNKAFCEIIGIDNSSIVVGKNITTILEPELYSKTLCGLSIVCGLKEYLAEYNKYVEETIIYDKKFHIIISIMRDITEKELEEQNKEELMQKSMEIADKVIAKNMRSVQEIASLLGETAAETKVALTSLKDTFKDDK